MSAAEGPALVVEARAYLAVYAAVALAPGPVAGRAAGVDRAACWPDRYFCGRTCWPSTPRARRPATASRTRAPPCTWRLVHFFAWNMPYHAEHHAYPAVPFHALPRLHGHVKTRLANLAPGSSRPPAP